MKFFGVILSVFLSISAFANKSKVTYLEPTIQSAKVGDVEFTLYVQDYLVKYTKTRENIGTRMFAKYKTKSNAELEDYAVVQFIRGCQFNTYVENGEVKYMPNYSRHFFGDVVSFQHKKWVIDSNDKDPMYYNAPKDELDQFKNRHGWYFWNKKGNFDQESEVHYFQSAPTKESSLYVMDHPGSSFIESGWAKNISLEFRTCLYKTKDIPQESKPDNLYFANAVKCFNWSSSLIYDHSAGKVTRPVGIHPYCNEDWSNVLKLVQPAQQ